MKNVPLREMADTKIRIMGVEFSLSRRSEEYSGYTNSDAYFFVIVAIRAEIFSVRHYPYNEVVVILVSIIQGIMQKTVQIVRAVDFEDELYVIEIRALDIFMSFNRF